MSPNVEERIGKLKRLLELQPSFPGKNLKKGESSPRTICW